MHGGFPSWGGFRRSEVRAVLGGRSLDQLPEMEDSDEDAWMYKLIDALSYADETRQDIVSLYL
jgi:hypothetical protein